MPTDTETAPVPHLSPREHTFLWLIAHGATASEAGEVLGTKAITEISTRIRTKMDCRTLAHAAYTARDLEMIGPYESCGLMAGYRAHHGRHEDACPACRRAFIAYSERQQTAALRARPVLTEPELRLLKAYDAGRTFKQICENWGLSASYLSRIRTSLYRKLDVSHLVPQARYRAALDEGRRQGFLRPLPRDRQRIIPPGRNPRRWGTTDLTDLQVRVLGATVGRSLSEAGEVLGMPSPQVSSHLARIYRKLDVLQFAHGERRDRAIKVARERGYNL